MNFNIFKIFNKLENKLYYIYIKANWSTIDYSKLKKHLKLL